MFDDPSAAAVWTALIASLILTPVALATRSWSQLLAAAMLSLLFSLAAIFSVGPFTLLITCLQLAGAVALRWSVGWRGCAALLLVGGLVWTVALPGPLWAGVRIPLIIVLPLALLASAAALVVGKPAPRRSARDNESG